MFGLVQGAFYLKAYWGHFGPDPFQFVAVGELALAGLTGIGMVLFLMLVALLIGGWKLNWRAAVLSGSCSHGWRQCSSLRDWVRCFGGRARSLF